MKKFRQVLWLLSGILLIACGVIFLINPGATLASISLYIGILILVAGVSGLVGYFSERRLYRSGWLLFEAILDILLGVLLLSSNGWLFMAALLPMLFSVWVIVRGFIGIIDAVESRYLPRSSWGVNLILSIVFVVLGVLSLLNPSISAVTISVLLGMIFIWAGIMTIAAWFKVRKVRKAVRQWRERYVEDESAFARDYPIAYALFRQRMWDGEFEPDEED